MNSYTPEQQHSVILRQLTLTNYKNYSSQVLAFSEHVNCLLGLNGMGKTNVLDAIHYLCLCKSLSGLQDLYVVKRGEEFFRLEGLFENREKSYQVVVKVQPRRKKVIEVNGVPHERLSDHIGLFPLVVIAPDETQLATEGSEVRRRFMDATLSQISKPYLLQLIRYNQVLAQRNALLKELSGSRSARSDLLDIYDQQLAEPGAVLYEQRAAFIRDMVPLLEKNYRFLSGGHEEVALEYQSQLSEMPLSYLLHQSRSRDQQLQRTSAGIHRDDLGFSLNGMQLKKFASQGQLKTFVLALKLAQYEILLRESGTRPLLLLDDVFDKLDSHRVQQLLLHIVQQPFGQVFITDTHTARVPELLAKHGFGSNVYLIENGKAISL